MAAHITTFTTSFPEKGVNQAGADTTFVNAMVTNPGAEVYLLDTNGIILLYHAPADKIKRNRVSLAPIRDFIRTCGQTYIKGDDTRRAEGRKIFSVAGVQHNGRIQGYVYVILGGDQYGSVMDSLLKSYVLPWGC